MTCQFNVLSQKQHPELLSQKQHPDLLITITYHPTSLDKSDIEVLSPNLCVSSSPRNIFGQAKIGLCVSGIAMGQGKVTRLVDT